MVDDAAKQSLIKRAFVVGGEGGFVQKKLIPNLKRHGVQVVRHTPWDQRKPLGEFPKDLDLIYIVTDMVGHSHAEPAVAYARAHNIPFVNGTRKWAETIERMEAAGFPVVSTGKQNNSEKKEYYMAALAAGTDPHLDTAAVLPAPPPAPPAPPAPPPAVSGGRLQAYLEALVQDPGMSNQDLVLLLNGSANFEVAAAARKVLGIRTSRAGGQCTTMVDSDVFLAAAAKYGIPAAVPKSTYVRALPLFVKKAPKAEQPKEQPKEQADALSLKSMPLGGPPEPVSTPTPAPAPAPTPVPAVGVEVWAEAPELRHALAQMRRIMTAHGIERLTVTPKGLSFRRVQVIEGELPV